MSADNPDVIQGRLGIESGDITELSPGELEPHPKNKEIYGDTDDAQDLDKTFRESIAEKGVLEPLVITEGKQIISGHRRWVAAQHAGLDSIPVRKTEFDNDLAEREALIEFNRQREKTPGQLVNEFEEMLEVEQKRAKERKDNAGGHVENLPQGDEGKARDKAADKVNSDVSGRTLEKGKKVKDKATSDDEPEEVQEAAQEAWQDLESGDESFSGAHERVKDAEAEANDETGDHDLDVLTSQETDEWSSPRELVEPIDEAISGFDLDPCSGAEQSPFAANTYTETDDGLSQSWQGRVWVNPPYSGVGDWVDKAADCEAETVVFLCKGDSSTNWRHRALESATCVLAIDHRLSFGDGDNAAPFASHIFVFGDCPEQLSEELRNHGSILIPGWQL